MSRPKAACLMSMRSTRNLLLLLKVDRHVLRAPLGSQALGVGEVLDGEHLEHAGEIPCDVVVVVENNDLLVGRVCDDGVDKVRQLRRRRGNHFSVGHRTRHLERLVGSPTRCGNTIIKSPIADDLRWRRPRDFGRGRAVVTVVRPPSGSSWCKLLPTPLFHLWTMSLPRLGAYRGWEGTR